MNNNAVLAVHRLTFPQEERRSQAGLLLARADNTNDTNGTTTTTSSSKTVPASPVKNADNATSNSSGEVSGGVAKENEQEGGGGGARQAQLASLLCKAEQYSMFIRQSQVSILVMYHTVLALPRFARIG